MNFLFLYFALHLSAVTSQPDTESKEFLLVKALKAFQHKKVRQRVFLSPLNKDYRNCFDRACPLPRVYSIEIEDASGSVLNPKAQGLFNRQHQPCTIENNCHWMFWTASKPICDSVPCLADRYDFFFNQNFDPPWKISSKNSQARYTYLKVPRDAIQSPLNWKGQNCLEFGSGLKFWSFSADGKIHCAPPVPAQDIIPSAGSLHEDQPVLNFILPGSVEPRPGSEDLRKMQIQTQLKIFTQSPRSVRYTIFKNGGPSFCSAGTCFAKSTIDLFLYDGSKIYQRGSGLDADLNPCNNQHKHCLPLSVKLDVLCHKQCRKMKGFLEVLQHEERYKLPIDLEVVEPELKKCKKGLFFQGWDKNGGAVCT